MINASAYVNLINASVNMLIRIRQQRAKVRISGGSDKSYSTSVKKAKVKKFL